MKTINKKFLTIFFVLTLLLTGLSCKKAFASTGAPKMITLTVGQCDSFTDADWQALRNSNCTDFVIIPALAGNYNSDEAGYENQLAPKVINAINKLATTMSWANIWIGTPGIGYSNCSIASSSLNPFYNYITYVKNQISSSIWNNNVRGIYMNEESVYGSVDYSNLGSNSTIKLMNDLSYRVHNYLGKSFLWIPYYGYGSSPATIIKNIGYVADRTSIFDYVIIQPHYYFDSTVQSNLAGVYYSVQNQAICYRNGVAVTQKTSNTIIGVEMESDWHILSPNSYSDFLGRYNEYVSEFSTFAGVYPLAFYWDTNLQKSLNERINPFY
ncbi:DUF4855 domain-containing protein [Inconstantimicrobium mannanitabidum]|uniref:Uncharacterized protein n=1 Tax=Inconstantimicrobium mannanitabidum TaxID=1604901 RepID=A0ACB5REB6_9CLOT|nr:DUF4855 domain-containing protein [Clostridium sp. TW13]GKX67620.1 hypothetical protein rsdtw13_28780 [Clostridium sp. TW13]